MTLEEFKSALSAKGLVLNDKQLGQLNDYAAFLVEYNEKINLTAITDYEGILEKHFYDSLLMSFGMECKGTLVDVGTGAGFPGVVMKIAYPELKVLLVEPIKKRCVFLEELISKLKLSDIEVINGRGEEYAINHREEYDYVTARAVTNLNNLIEICGAMVKVNGYFVALRGSCGNEEINDSKKAIKEMGFVIEKTITEHLSDEASRIISYMCKKDPTPNKYPRKYSIIKQRPL